jgi:hypothetical protein
MANVLNIDTQIAVISSLCEGSSIRSIERITGVHRDTIMSLGVRVGQGCTALMDAKMRHLDYTRLEMDEIWGYVESVPVTVSFQGKTVWDGIVEVFRLKGHPQADRVYAWIHQTDDPAHPKRHATVLHIPPVVSPQTAVQAAIVQEFREHGKAN